MLKAFFGRLSDAAIHAAPIGSLLGMILFYIAVLAAELLRIELSATALLGMLVGLHIISLVFMMLHHLASGAHKYDQDIIGRSFGGISKKSRIFSRALDLHFNRRINASLSGFKMLSSEYADKLTDDEKALVSFYTGRCYEQLRYYPNALTYYERAEEQGFGHSVLPFLMARCSGANGDADDALALYNKVLEDPDSPFRELVYVNIGRMYLDSDEPAEAMKWYSKAISERMSLGEAYGGAAIAQLMLGDFTESERLRKMAFVCRIKDPNGFSEYYDRVHSAASAVQSDRE
ncbi:MAG: hypothetical protein MJ079_01095 [Ruminococcus sp.]|nr:hypothetical protein [Ruminococcus sp.]